MIKIFPGYNPVGGGIKVLPNPVDSRTASLPNSVMKCKKSFLIQQMEEPNPPLSYEWKDQKGGRRVWESLGGIFEGKTEIKK